MGDLPTTRVALQQLATHVLARRRHAVTGRFGLRPSPAGLATPAFGDDVEVIRISGHFLVHERAGSATIEPISTLAAAAELVGADLSTDFAAGADSPALAPPDEPLPIDDTHVRTLADWWAWGSAALDEVIGATSSAHDATAAQLWPEHFDLGCSVTIGEAVVNLGASPGDAFEPLPYLYVGPWSSDRPGDPAYWNAPFGAVLRAADLPSTDHRTTAARFFRDGLERW